MVPANMETSDHAEVNSSELKFHFYSSVSFAAQNHGRVKVTCRSINKSMLNVGKQQPSLEVEAKGQQDSRADEDSFRRRWQLSRPLSVT